MAKAKTAGPVVCPYLGQADDPATYFLQPSASHRCGATLTPGRIDVEHQLLYCLGDGFRRCPRFAAKAAGEPLPADNPPAAAPTGTVDAPAAPRPEGTAPTDLRRAGRLDAIISRLPARLSFEDWVVAITVLILVLVVVYYAFLAQPLGMLPGAPTPEAAIRGVAAALNSTATPTPIPAATPLPPATRLPRALSPATAAVPTMLPGALVAALSPAELGVGSYSSVERIGRFGMRELSVGTYQGATYLGGLEIGLQRIPKNSKLTYAALELTGLVDTNLALTGTFRVEMLAPEVDAAWSSLTYESLGSAPSDPSGTGWTLDNGALGSRLPNQLVLSDVGLAALAGRLAASGKVSFRLRSGPSTEDNLFAWDTGYGEGFGTRPVLRVGFVPPPPTPGPKPGEPTALPLIVWVGVPTPAPTATPPPAEVPAALKDKILFISDRFGGAQLMVLDPASRRVGQVTQPWVYDAAVARQTRAGGQAVRVEERPCGSGATPVVSGGVERSPGDPARRCAQIIVASPDGQAREVTPSGFVHYDPVLSADGQWLAYVSQITGGDEIFKIRLDSTGNTRLTENTWEWDKHPSFSPDGTRIVFWSNREGRAQLYTMNADGTGVINISQSPFNDRDPVWVR